MATSKKKLDDLAAELARLEARVAEAPSNRHRQAREKELADFKAANPDIGNPTPAAPAPAPTPIATQNPLSPVENQAITALTGIAGEDTGLANSLTGGYNFGDALANQLSGTKLSTAAPDSMTSTLWTARELFNAANTNTIDPQIQYTADKFNEALGVADSQFEANKVSDKLSPEQEAAAAAAKGDYEKSGQIDPQTQAAINRLIAEADNATKLFEQNKLSDELTPERVELIRSAQDQLAKSGKIDPQMQAALTRLDQELQTAGNIPGQVQEGLDRQKAGLGGYNSAELNAMRDAGLQSVIDQSQGAQAALLGSLGARNLQGGVAAKLAGNLATNAVSQRANLERNLLADNAAVQERRLGDYMGNLQTATNSARDYKGNILGQYGDISSRAAQLANEQAAAAMSNYLGSVQGADDFRLAARTANQNAAGQLSGLRAGIFDNVARNQMTAGDLANQQKAAALQAWLGQTNANANYVKDAQSANLNAFNQNNYYKQGLMTGFADTVGKGVATRNENKMAAFNAMAGAQEKIDSYIDTREKQNALIDQGALATKYGMPLSFAQFYEAQQGRLGTDDINKELVELAKQQNAGSSSKSGGGGSKSVNRKSGGGSSTSGTGSSSFSNSGLN